MMAITQEAGGAGDQHRPHVALCRGHQELGSDLAEPRHPHPVGAIAAVVRRQGQRLEAPFFPSFDSLGTLKRILSTGHDYSWFVLTRRSPRRNSCCRAPSRTSTSRPKDWRAVLKNRRGGKAPPSVAGVPGKGRGFRRPRQSGRSGRRHERADRRQPDRLRPAARPDRGARPRGRASYLQGCADHGHPRRAQISRRQALPRDQAAQDPRPASTVR